MAEQTKREQLNQLRASMEGDRAPSVALWQSLADYFCPTRPRFTVSEKNQPKNYSKVINSTGYMSVRTLQSGLHSGVTSPARPWFKLETPYEELNERKNVQVWLESLRRGMEMVFQASNLYNSFHSLYGDMGVFGCGAVAELADDVELMRCYTYPIGSWYVAHDERGQPSHFLRDMRMTVRQVVRMFGAVKGTKTIDWTNISNRVHSAWDNGKYLDPVDVTWAVFPNDDHDPSKLLPKFKRFSSCHWETSGGEGKILRESGFDTFPVMVPRWDVTGEDDYGTDSPGFVTLGDNRSLQLQEKAYARAVEKQLNPPVQGPAMMRSQKVSLIPGDFTATTGGGKIEPIHEVRADLNHMMQTIQATEGRIREGWFVPLFMIVNSDARNQPATAYEIAQKQQEALLALGPILERTKDELLDPTIDRAFSMMVEAGIPDPPEEVQGMPIRVQYTSIMAIAQKMLGIGANERLLSQYVPLSQMSPDAKHTVDLGALVRDSARRLGVDPRLVRSKEEVDALVQAENQAAQQAAQAEQTATYAKAARDAAAAPLNQDTALGAILGGGVNPNLPATGVR